MEFILMKGSLKEKQRELSEYVFSLVFEEFYKYKFNTVKDQIHFYYSGEYKVAEIYESQYVDYETGETSRYKSYDLHTSSAAGSQTTPLDEDMPANSNVDWMLTIHVPGNLTAESKLVLDVDYDMGWHDDIAIHRIEGEIFSNFYHRKYSL